MKNELFAVLLTVFGQGYAETKANDNHMDLAEALISHELGGSMTSAEFGIQPDKFYVTVDETDLSRTVIDNLARRGITVYPGSEWNGNDRAIHLIIDQPVSRDDGGFDVKHHYVCTRPRCGSERSALMTHVAAGWQVIKSSVIWIS